MLLYAYMAYILDTIAVRYQHQKLPNTIKQDFMTYVRKIDSKQIMLEVIMVCLWVNINDTRLMN